MKVLLSGLAGLLLTGATHAETLFAPPLDTPLRYEVIQEKQAGGPRAQTIRSIDELNFSTDGKDFILRWQGGTAEVTAPPPMDKVLVEIIRMASATPLLMHVSGEGEIGAVINLAHWRSVQGQALAKLRTELAGGPEASVLKIVFDNLDAALAKQTDQQVTNELTEIPSYVLAGASLALAPGAEVSAEVEMPFSIGPGTIPAKLTVARLRDAPGGLARLRFVTRPDAEGLTDAMKTFVEGVVANTPLDSKAAVAEQFKSQQLRLEIMIETDYDPRTGLAHTVRQSKTIAFGNQPPRVDRVLIRMIR